MSSTKWIAKLVLAAASAAAFLPHAYAQQSTASFTSADDTVFLALRDASRREDTARAIELASRLTAYPIPSYVEYYRLKPRIKEATQAEIRDYLARYDGSAIADRLRNDWLLELGRLSDWQTFDEQYPLFVLNDDLQLKCYALMSKASKGENVSEAARAILVSLKDYGSACPSLIAMLAQNRQFNADDVWSQIRLAGETNNAALARRFAPLVDAYEGDITQAIEKPTVTVARGPGKTRASQELFIVALGRVARNNVEQAVNSLKAVTFQLNAEEEKLPWAQIALPASQKLMPEASEYWRKAGSVQLSLEGHQWRARAALRSGNWKQVQAAIDAMPPSLRSDSAWIYWLARSYAAQGRNEDALPLFSSIANLTDFYGQLASEDLGQKITAPPRPVPLTREEIAQAAGNTGLRDAIKFFELGLRFEGTREWNWQLRRMSERQLLATAEFARQNSLLDRMVNTSDRTRTEIDFTQRFPTPYNDIMQTATQALGLDKAWVYGLIRQESRFVTVARSHVGASGLMQLMPATAKYVANKIGMQNFTQSQVNDITTNITLGTNYLSMVLNTLDGSQALATAAYNAGPGRPRNWRSTLTRTVEGAIFAETIPFTETRGYVKSVLSNATYYAALFENRPQSLKARLGTVGPKEIAATVLGDLP